MSAPPIRIRIGASVDASVDAAFKTIESRARKAQAALNAAQARSAQNLNKDVEAAIYRQARAFDAVASAAKRAADATTDGARRTRGGVEQATDEVAKANRARESFARRTSHRTTRFAIWGGRAATHALGGAVRGMGVDTSIASVFSNITEQERIAAVVSNKAYIKGKNNRVDPKELVREQREIAKNLGGSTNAGMTAMESFVNQRGNLGGWRALAPDLIKRSISQGANPADIGLAAAKVDAILSNVKQYSGDENEGRRNQATLGFIDNQIVQGKEGSIDFDMIGKQLPKLAGLATMFGGDVGKNLSDLMTVAQFAEAGMAMNPMQATTFTANTAQDLINNSGKFKDAGVNVFQRDKDGQAEMRPILDILTETVAATAEDRVVKKRGQPAQTMNTLEQLKVLFPNQRSFKGFYELRSLYKGMGGGEEGMAALKKRLGEFGGSATNQVESDFDAIQNTTGNKAERFNARMEDAADRLKDRLVPALSNASDSIVSFAGMLADVAAYAVENPFKSLLMGMSASFAAAASESFARVGVENLVNAARPGATATGGMGVLGGAASVLTIAALAVTTLTVGTAIIDAFFANKANEDRERVERQNETANMGNKVRKLAQDGDYAGAAEVLEKRIARQEQDLEATGKSNSFGEALVATTAATLLPDWLASAVGMPTSDETADTYKTREAQVKEELVKQQAELVASRQALARLVELAEFAADQGAGGGIPPLLRAGN